MILKYIKKAELPPRDGWSVFKGFLIACAGAAIIIAIEYVAKQDFGKWSPLITAAASTLINYLRKKIFNENKNDCSCNGSIQPPPN